MNKQTITVIVAAVVLFAVGLVGALAFTGKDPDAGNVQTMPNGQTMTGMTDTTHTMSNGETMTGMDMGDMQTSP